jgi:hypothetical protein
MQEICMNLKGSSCKAWCGICSEGNPLQECDGRTIFPWQVGLAAAARVQAQQHARSQKHKNNETNTQNKRCTSQRYPKHPAQAQRLKFAPCHCLWPHLLCSGFSYSPLSSNMLQTLPGYSSKPKESNIHVHKAVIFIHPSLGHVCILAKDSSAPRRHNSAAAGPNTMLQHAACILRRTLTRSDGTQVRHFLLFFEIQA